MNVLEQAQEIVKNKWPKGKGWKVFIIISLVVLGIIGIIALVLKLLVSLVRGLTAGGARNKDLYLPSMGRRR